MKKSILALAMASIVSGMENISDVQFYRKNPDPEYKRKKCKSCTHFTMAYQTCSRDPYNQACSNYCKRK